VAGGRVTQGALPNISADLTLMSALFEELIDNAMRFRSEEPPVVEITATASPRGNAWHISVADNGIGLNESDRERIFRPFAKGSERAGVGMGLAICRRIAQIHGGEIRGIPRAPGAEFRLELPQ
jgi:signal transduction histidine kinase